jgi:DNA processing protein
LAERIAETAAVISELPLSSPPLPGHFPQRNRIVSGLALGTLVIEAAERSGSLISARCAVDENREVFAVPGPITSPNSRGVHRLIQEGAKLVTDSNDIIDELRPNIRKELSFRTPEKEGSSAGTGDLQGDEARVFEVLVARGAVDAERLVMMAQMPVDRVMAALVALEIKGRVRAFVGGIYGARKAR